MSAGGTRGPQVQTQPSAAQSPKKKPVVIEMPMDCVVGCHGFYDSDGDPAIPPIMYHIKDGGFETVCQKCIDEMYQRDDPRLLTEKQFEEWYAKHG
jgi:hypothetical protein